MEETFNHDNEDGGSDLDDVDDDGGETLDPLGDWDTKKFMTGPPEDIADAAKAQASVANINDSIVSEAMALSRTLRDTYGDKDEAVARIASDLMASLRMIYLEMSRRPGRVACRVIRAERSYDKQQQMIAEARELLDELEVLLRDEHTADHAPKQPATFIDPDVARIYAEEEGIG